MTETERPMPANATPTELASAKLNEYGSTVLGREVLPDHVHLLRDVDPRIGVASVVAKIQGYTSHARAAGAVPMAQTTAADPLDT